MNIDEIFKLAIQNHQKNNLKEAENLYNEILKIDPDHIASLNNLGLIFHSSNNLPKAEKFFKKAGGKFIVPFPKPKIISNIR